MQGYGVVDQAIALNRKLAEDVAAQPSQIASAVGLLDGGATVPFIARYRKEATGGLSDAQLRLLEDRLRYRRDMEERRASILDSIESQGKLTDALRESVMSADSKSILEDLYLPYKQKRRTKGQMAIEAGLTPLAEQLWSDNSADPDTLALDYLNADAGVADAKAALEGARYILMERFAEDATLIGRLRELLEDRGLVCSKVVAGQESEGEKFRDWFDYQETIKTVPSHRALALFRGRTAGALDLSIGIRDGDGVSTVACEQVVAGHTGYREAAVAADPWRKQVVSWTWRVKLRHHLETDLFGSLRERSEADAIAVFAKNLKSVLLAAPAGNRPTLGLDPGFRTGVKLAVVDTTGKVLEHATIYPHAPQNRWDASIATLANLCQRHGVELLAVGDGTASRETERLAGELIARHKDLTLTRVLVSEAGASVYSASELADRELPDYDVSIRGAVSIARRLQDPLAELVKIDPKSIGVGQYQHDVSQVSLARSLDTTVEDCVNHVGVDLNTASPALLQRVAGLSVGLASGIVDFRDANGAFRSRKQLLKVPRLGPVAFEQCAGFLRIRDGDHALDASQVHPEAYPVVEAMCAASGVPVNELVGQSEVVDALDPAKFVTEQFGLPTVRDIVAELRKPGRDPRPAFVTAAFADGVESIGDLKPNQVLEGKVTNVTQFGAFVDVGVHQDGLVHISALSDKFVKDPADVVSAGDVVKVKVMEVDLKRKRIALSMRLSDDARDRDAEKPARRDASGSGRNTANKRGGAPKARRESQPNPPSALAEQLAAALKKRS